MLPDDICITVQLEDTEITVTDEVPEIELILDIHNFNVTVTDPEVYVKVESSEMKFSFDAAEPDTTLILETIPDVIVLASDNLGAQGPKGDQGDPGPPGADSTVPGPPGPPSGLFTYIHDQSSLSDVWIITHNNNYYPSVSVVDTGGSVVFPNVEYDSEDQVTISFEAATSGKAYLN